MQWKIVSYIQVFSNVSSNKQDTRKIFYDTKLRVKPSSHRIKTCPRRNSCLFKRICIEWQCSNEIIYQLSVARAIWKTNNIEDRQLFMANKLFQCIYYKNHIKRPCEIQHSSFSDGRIFIIGHLYLSVDKTVYLS